MQKEGGSGSGGRGHGDSSGGGSGHGGHGHGGRGQQAPQDHKNVKLIGSAEQFNKELSNAGDRLVCFLLLCTLYTHSKKGRRGLVCRVVWTVSTDSTSVCRIIDKVYKCGVSSR